LHVAKGSCLLKKLGREGGRVEVGARAMDDGVFNDCNSKVLAPEPVRAPCCCLRKEGDMPVRLDMACISACIDMGLRCARAPRRRRSGVGGGCSCLEMIFPPLTNTAPSVKHIEFLEAASAR
jgi:hypothetical protein